MGSTKALQKIRAVIYNVRDGRFTDEEGMLEVKKIMDKHYSEKLKRREWQMNKKEIDEQEEKLFSEIEKLLEIDKMSVEQRTKFFALWNDYIEVSKLQDELEEEWLNLIQWRRR